MKNVQNTTVQNTSYSFFLGLGFLPSGMGLKRPLCLILLMVSPNAIVADSEVITVLVSLGDINVLVALAV